MVDYNRKIIRAPKGEGRQEVILGNIEIPDLWHIAMSFPTDSPEQKAILETWHLAHDLKKNLAGDIS